MIKNNENGRVYSGLRVAGQCTCNCLIESRFALVSVDILKFSTPAAGRERSGSVIECLTRDRGAAGSSLTRVTALWSLSKTHLS